jgi:hypothetical protein
MEIRPARTEPRFVVNLYSRSPFLSHHDDDDGEHVQRTHRGRTGPLTARDVVGYRSGVPARDCSPLLVPHPPSSSTLTPLTGHRVPFNTATMMVQQPQDWDDHAPLPAFAASSPPQTAFLTSTSISQRRRSSAANSRPSAPPPSIPIPNVPSVSGLLAPEPSALEVFEDGTLSSTHVNGGPRFTNTYTRPAPSPSLSAVASFSQSRQAMTVTSSSINYSAPAYQSSDDLSDPPPQSYLHSTASTSPPSSRRAEASTSDRDFLRPNPPEQAGRGDGRSEHRPSSRRALTRALALAREAVQLDSTNDNPEAAVQAYARSVALLSEVMERVRRGEDSTTDGRRRRRRSVAAQEDEIRRLQSIVSPQQLNPR